MKIAETEVPCPAGLRAQRFWLEGREHVVLSYLAPLPPLPPCLTASEQAVARAALAGVSNAGIARQRRVSERTVANQLAAVFRKLGVASRAELAAWIHHSAARGTPQSMSVRSGMPFIK